MAKGCVVRMCVFMWGGGGGREEEGMLSYYIKLSDEMMYHSNKAIHNNANGSYTYHTHLDHSLKDLCNKDNIAFSDINIEWWQENADFGYEVNSLYVVRLFSKVVLHWTILTITK